MMAKYRKKQVVVEAVQWGRMQVPTLEGTLWASPRDYIIKGINGEFYQIYRWSNQHAPVLTGRGKLK